MTARWATGAGAEAADEEAVSTFTWKNWASGASDPNSTWASEANSEAELEP
jgi:hypothetical protein